MNILLGKSYAEPCILQPCIRARLPYKTLVMLTSVFRPRQGERAFFLFFTLPWASGLLSPPRGRDFVCSYLSSLFAIGQAKRKSILHFVKLGIRFSNLRNFFLLRAVGDSIRLHICASEYSSEYLSGANILRLRPL